VDRYRSRLSTFRQLSRRPARVCPIIPAASPTSSLPD